MADHAAYDKAKAHQYYVDHYRPHPRQRRAGQLVEHKPREASNAFTVKTDHGTTYRITPEQRAVQLAYANKRITQMKVRLRTLGNELRKKLAAAKEAERNANKPQTAAEKAKAARDSKKYRDKHETELATKAKQAASKEPAKPKADTVDSIRGQIVTVKARLKDAVAKQRALASATQNG